MDAQRRGQNGAAAGSDNQKGIVPRGEARLKADLAGAGAARGEPYVCNAVIESASIGLSRGCFLDSWLTLNYGGSGQGFGGYVLGGTPTAAAGRHASQPNIAAEYIVSVLRAAGVEQWSELPGKTIRVRKATEWGAIVAIGHIVKDDCWFEPEAMFKAMKMPGKADTARVPSPASIPGGAA